VSRRLDKYGRYFFSDLRDTWDLFRGYVDTGLTASPPTLADLSASVRARFISPQGTYLLRVFPSEDTWNFGPLKKICPKPLECRPQCRGRPGPPV